MDSPSSTVLDRRFARAAEPLIVLQPSAYHPAGQDELSTKNRCLAEVRGGPRAAGQTAG
jgi:hypothetical protein